MNHLRKPTVGFLMRCSGRFCSVQKNENTRFHWCRV